MKTLISILLLLPTLTFASTHTYNCKFQTNFMEESFSKKFLLGGVNREIKIDHELAGRNKFFQFVMFENDGLNQIQYMEGTIRSNNVYQGLVGIMTQFEKGQKEVKIGSYICGTESTCWNLNCELN